MGIIFKKETFRDDFTFRNSPEAIARFPFPFHEDKYMYAVNLEPHVTTRFCLREGLRRR
jgi:dimethylamine monooxygenase subunit A